MVTIVKLYFKLKYDEYDSILTQPAITCSKLMTGTIEQGVTSVKSYQ